MSPNPESFLDHLREHGYHPRSDKHSNALARAIVDDLVVTCDPLAQRASRGEVVFSLNFTLRAGRADWNVDLVLGSPPQVVEPSAGVAIVEAEPSYVEIAIELKAVMTEHRKAVKNRKRDLEAHHEHVHNYDNQTIAGGVIIVNAASRFASPLRRGEVTEHKNPERLVRHCIDEARSIATRGGKTGYGLEACCVLVVDTDNQILDAASYADTHVALSTGDPLHYDSFIQSVCRAYRQRFP
ncbi:MAG: hypothetical protein AAGD00_00280 [Planctomycetota bacterium]